MRDWAGPRPIEVSDGTPARADGCGVGAGRAAAATAGDAGHLLPGSSGRPQRDARPLAHRLPVARPAGALRPLAHRRLALPPLDARGALGPPPRGAPARPRRGGADRLGALV